MRYGRPRKVPGIQPAIVATCRCGVWGWVPDSLVGPIVHGIQVAHKRKAAIHCLLQVVADDADRVDLVVAGVAGVQAQCWDRAEEEVVILEENRGTQAGEGAGLIV